MFYLYTRHIACLLLPQANKDPWVPGAAVIGTSELLCGYWELNAVLWMSSSAHNCRAISPAPCVGYFILTSGVISLWQHSQFTIPPLTCELWHWARNIRTGSLSRQAAEVGLESKFISSPNPEGLSHSTQGLCWPGSPIQNCKRPELAGVWGLLRVPVSWKLLKTVGFISAPFLSDPF